MFNLDKLKKEFDALNDFIESVCNNLVNSARFNIKAKGMFSLVLSGGRTPTHIFNYIKQNCLHSIDWSLVHVFWTDERCVGPENERSNFRNAYKLLPSHIPNIASCNRIEGELGPEVAASKYSNRITDFLAKYKVRNFDFCLLGMGEDGHVASLFPRIKNVEIDSYVSYTPKEYAGTFRVSLTENIINSTDELFLLVTNEKKLNILKSGNSAFPINRIKNSFDFVLLNG